MSLQRLLLRTAFVRALSGQTIAQDRVWDSRIAPPQTSRLDDHLPYIAIYSDTDRGMNMAGPGGDPRPIWFRTVDVVLEIGVGTWREVTIEGPQGNPEQGYSFNIIETDAELSMMLDLLELQIHAAIWREGKHSRPLRDLVQHWEEWSSIAGFNREANIKIASRQITARCKVSNECLDMLAGLMGHPRARPGKGAFPPLTDIAPHLAPGLEQLAQAPDFSTLRELLQLLNGDTPIPELKPGFRLSMLFGTPPETNRVEIDTTPPPT